MKDQELQMVRQYYGRKGDIENWDDRQRRVTSRYPEPRIGDSVPIENGFFNVRVGMTRACIYAMGPAEASPLKIGLAHHPIAR
jgi:hypothetical protein